LPIIDYTKAHLNTINAATKHMIPQKSGVLMGITATPSHIAYPFMAGFPVAWAAVEALLRIAAAEMGPHGIRTVCLHSSGSPESAKSIGKTLSHLPQVTERAEGWEARSAARNLLNHRPTLKEVGYMAAFMASDKAGATTGARVNLTGGVVND
jgi:NAD(P)-dependent dehydrogenase (short-subunit alcohol dehydrogenase family)